MTIEKAKDWLLYTVALLVSKPEKVQVESKLDEMGVLFTLRVADGDGGSVIGRGGKTANALREILNSLGYAARAKISLKVDLPDRVPGEKA